MKKLCNSQAIQSEKGFTLLETIVAVTLVAMMAVGIWSVFRTGIRSWARGTEIIDASQRHRIIYDLVRKQAASAFPLAAPVDPAFPNITYPLFRGTETSMEFVSLNSLRFQESPGLTLVNYEMSPDQEGTGYSLVEREKRYLGQTLDSSEDIDLPNSISLFENLSNGWFEYKNPDVEEDEESWVREWDAQQQSQLPAAVAMNLESLDANGNVQTHQIIVPVHATEEYTRSNARNTSNIRRLGRRGSAARAADENSTSDLQRERILRNRGNAKIDPGSIRGRALPRGAKIRPGGNIRIPPGNGSRGRRE